MKTQVRRNVFETNSSSMHSLVVLKDDCIKKENDLKEDMYIGVNGEWDIWENDLYFGRSPFQCLSTFESKVRYAIASLCGYRNDKEEIFEEIKRIVLDVIPECKNVKLPNNYYSGTDEFYYGGVDEDILSGFLAKYNINLKEFLVNSKYIVMVDGDEYCIFEDLKRSGIINSEVIEEEYN